MTDHLDHHPQSLVKKVLIFGSLAILGAAFGAVVAHFADPASMSGGWADALALVIGAALLGVAAINAVVMVVRPSALPEGCGAPQVIVLGLAGIMFLAPIFAADHLRPDFVFGGIVVLFLVQTAANLLLWRRADEMMRRVMGETSTLAFWALQAALFLYAAAERLGLVSGISAWGMTGILMSVYLVASMVAAARRGLH